MFASSLVGLLMVNNISINASSEITTHNGDTVTGLAQKYRVSSSALEKTNHLGGNAARLGSGHQLRLPNQTDQAVAPSTKDSNVKQDTEDNRSSNSISTEEQSAKNWIAYHESRGEYNVSNGRYYGKYELDISMLKGDLSKANQERTADKYVHQRYGSWVKAKQFWEAHNWY